MKILKFYISVVIMVTSLFVGNGCYAYQNEQEGFRNLKWGMLPYELPQEYRGRKSVGLSHDKVHGVIQSDNLFCDAINGRPVVRFLLQGKGYVSGAIINNEILTFVDHKLFGVDVLITTNQKEFCKKMKDMYGKPDEEMNSNRGVMVWKGAKTILLLGWTPREGNSTMTVSLLDSKAIEKLWNEKNSPKDNGW